MKTRRGATPTEAKLAAMLWGILILLGGSILLTPLENWIHKHLEGAGDFLAEHIYLPLARVLIVIGFLYCLFPSPLLNAALLAQLEGDSLARPPVQSLINVLFAIGLVLPLLPQTQKFSGLILPIQTLIGAWLLMGSLPLPLTLPKPMTCLLGYALMSLACHSLARIAARPLAEHKRWDPLSVYDALILICQPPMVLWITRAYELA